MSTSAIFWIGNPENLGRRNYLGMKFSDGHPSMNRHISSGINFNGINSKKQFKKKVAYVLDASAPKTSQTKDEPIPESYLIHPSLIINYTYAWFDNRVRVKKFNGEWIIWGSRNLMSELPPTTDWHNSWTGTYNSQRGTTSAISSFNRSFNTDGTGSDNM